MLPMGYALHLSELLPWLTDPATDSHSSSAPESSGVGSTLRSFDFARAAHLLREAMVGTVARQQQIEAAVLRMLTETERAVAAGVSVDFEASIEEMRRAEGVLREQLDGATSSLADLPQDWVVVTQFLEVFERGVELMRDGRWQLLALRAKSEPQRGPMFESASDLVRFLGE